jgi:hypothetical protein
MMNDPYLVWSNEHGGWWKAGGWGYSTGLNEAGHFSRDQAIRICRNALPTAAHIGMISEIPVRLADVSETLEGQVIPACITSKR